MKSKPNPFEPLHQFSKKHALHNGGYLTIELANEYAFLKCKIWGSNLVYLGANFRDGAYFPEFNLFD